jgi:hypothetical protein
MEMAILVKTFFCEKLKIMFKIFLKYTFGTVLFRKVNKEISLGRIICPITK